VALNCAIAIGMANGPETGLAEPGRIPHSERLKNYPFLPAAEGKFLFSLGRSEEAVTKHCAARGLVRSGVEKSFFEGKVEPARKPSGADVAGVKTTRHRGVLGALDDDAAVGKNGQLVGIKRAL
jgi:hypothetical protein